MSGLVHLYLYILLYRILYSLQYIIHHLILAFKFLFTNHAVITRDVCGFRMKTFITARKRRNYADYFSFELQPKRSSL